MTAQTLEAILNSAFRHSTASGPFSQTLDLSKGQAHAGVRVTLYTGTQLIAGRLEPGGRRVSDFLNDHTTSYLWIHQATVCELLAEGHSPAPANLLTVRKDAVQLVVPEDAPQMLRPRVPTQQLTLELWLPLFRVCGGLHRRGTDPSVLGQLLSGFSRQFLPVSDASIEYLPDARFNITTGIVLVNAHHIQFWVERSDADSSTPPAV